MQGTYRRVKAVFADALALPTAEREGFVRAACGDDARVREEALRLVRVRRRLMTRATAAPGSAPRARRDGHPPRARHGGGPPFADADLRESTMPRVGDVVAQRYELAAVLGVGGFGRVFRAFDRIYRRDVALKVSAVAGGWHGRRHLAELATLRRARVPGVVELLDDGVDRDWAYLVMEHVPGDWFPGAGVVPGDVATLLRRTEALLEALARLHAAGVLHRDLKPANVLVRPDGGVTLVDLGIAEDETDGGEPRGATFVVGTAGYMAPERAGGAPATVRGDLYSVGVMLAECLSTDASDAATDAVGRAAVDEPRLLVLDALDRAGIPPRGAAALRALLAHRPGDRPASALAVLRELRAGGEADVLRLPRLGNDAALAAALAAARTGRSLDIVARRGFGGTRLLEDLASVLLAEGRGVLRASPEALPGMPAAAQRDAMGGAAARDDARRARLLRQIEDGAALLVDDFHRMVPAVRDEVEGLRSRGAVVRVLRRPGTGPSVALQPLAVADLLPLVRGPDRLHHVREDVAAELWRRTRGSPACLAREVATWCASGLADWADGLSLRPDGLARLRAQRLVSTPSEDAPVDGGAETRRVWAAVTLAGVPVRARTLARALDRPEAAVVADLGALQDGGVVALDGDGRAAVLEGSPDLAGLDAEVKGAWSRAIAADLPAGSDEQMQHLLAAGLDADACRVAVRLARGHVAAGRLADARYVLDRALPMARRGEGADVALYAEAMEVMAETALGLATRAAVDLALYHLDLSPGEDARLSAWRPLLQAAAGVLDADPDRALRLLPTPHGWPSEAHRRAYHVIGIHAAGAASPGEHLRRVKEAARWVRERQGRDARSLLSAWTGWLRYDAGRYAAAAGLHARAARLTRRPRARTTAWINAAAAALEAGALPRAQEWATAALRASAEARDGVNEARAERILRQVTYRGGAAGPVDEELVAAAERLPVSVTRGMLLLGEAAFAWRSRRLALAAELAGRAASDLETCRQPAAAALALALAETCAGPRDGALGERLGEAIAAGGPPGLVAQAAALMAREGRAAEIPEAAVSSSLDWVRRTSGRDERREVLSPREVADWIGADPAGPRAKGGPR